VTGQAACRARYFSSILGASIIAVDRCGPIDSVGYPLPTLDDLEHTVKLVEDLDREIVAVPADVRDLAALENVVNTALQRLGWIDIVVANAGIAGRGRAVTAPLIAPSSPRGQPGMAGARI
jgi:NAD(P)-dependent dehydrogenase (short-subunit alcohol dehydrogenase family)